MEFYGTSPILQDLLDRQERTREGLAGPKARGKIARTVGASAAGIGAGDQSGGTDRLLTGVRGGGNRNPIGMGKTGAAKAPASFQGTLEKRQRPTGGGEPFLWLIADNVDNMPTRQGAIRRAPSLVCIDGGKP